MITHKKDTKESTKARCRVSIKGNCRQWDYRWKEVTCKDCLDKQTKSEEIGKEFNNIFKQK